MRLEERERGLCGKRGPVLKKSMPVYSITWKEVCMLFI